MGDEVSDLRQRRDNRLVLEKTTLSEAYLNGRLEIVLYGKAPIMSEELSYAICISKCAAVLDNRPAKVGVQAIDADECNGGQNEVMLVVIVEIMEAPKRLVCSVGRAYFLKEHGLSAGEGLLYRKERIGNSWGPIGYEVLSIFPHWEMKFGICGMGSSNSRAEVIQGPSEVMHGITDAERGHLRDWLQGPVNKAKGGGVTIRGNEIWLDLDAVPFSAQRLGHGPDLINVAVGPLNL